MQALVQAEISTPGKADSFLQATHVVRTRRAHQVTLAALYILKHRAYSNYCQQDEMLLEFGQRMVCYERDCQYTFQILTTCYGAYNILVMVIC